MVTVSEAKEKIILSIKPLPLVTKSTESALGYVLAKDVLAPLSLPSFRQSSMDGFAVIHSDITALGVQLKIVNESKAGQADDQILKSGEAIRIFTGAPVPEGATAVVMQEHTERINDEIVIHEFPVSLGKNVRNIGQQITKGNVALPKDTFLSPGSIGFLLGMNVEDVVVYQKPKIGILVTGDELAKKGDKLNPGQVYESNSGMLVAALHQEGIQDVEIKYCRDDLHSTIAALAELSEQNDVVLTSGGISVGDYDFVGKALEAIEAETVFYKVKQKPGKPLLFAKKQEKLFFALPGNPASSLVCYYEYVLPAIRKMSGRTDCFLRSLFMPVKNAYSFQGERDEFLKATATQESVTPLDGQESFSIRSFAIANAIIYLPAEQNMVAEGDMVEVHLLPG